MDLNHYEDVLLKKLDQPRSRRKSSNPLGKTILEVGDSLLVVVTLHAHLNIQYKARSDKMPAN